MMIRHSHFKLLAIRNVDGFSVSCLPHSLSAAMGNMVTSLASYNALKTVFKQMTSTERQFVANALAEACQELDRANNSAHYNDNVALGPPLCHTCSWLPCVFCETNQPHLNCRCRGCS